MIKTNMTSLADLELNRNLYKTPPQTVETLGADDIASNVPPPPSNAVASGNTVIDINTNAMTINGSQLTPGTIPQTTLDIANWGWTQTSVFSTVDSDTVQWGSGTFTSADGTSIYSISSGNTGNMTLKTYVYLDINVSTTAYQVTTTQTNAVGIGKVLIAVCQNATGGATYNLVQASQIVADNIAANTIVAQKMNVGQLSAITADLGTITAGTITGVLIQTALTGRRIEITSSPTNTIKFYDTSTLYGSLEVDKSGTDGYIKLISQDGAGLIIYTGVGASSFGSASLNGQGGTVSVSGNASNSFAELGTLNGGTLTLAGGPSGDVISTDDGSGNPIAWDTPYFTGQATFEDEVAMVDVLTYKTTPMPRVFHGYVNADGTSGTPFPSGWSISNSSTGVYVVTHDLSTNFYSVVIVPKASTVKNCTISSRGVDTFTARIANLSDALENNDFMFILCCTA